MVPRAAEMQQRATQPRAATRKLPVILILVAQDQTKAVERRVLEPHQRAMIQRAVLKHAGIN